jgi:cellobiose-specific phosphotransferase system component IIA
MRRKDRIEKEKQAEANMLGYVGHARQDIGLALMKARAARKPVAEALLLQAEHALNAIYGDD